MLYHYFPTKSDFVVAVLRRSRDELERRMAPDLTVELSVGERLDASIDAFLGYVQEHAVGFLAIARARGGEDEKLREVVAENRARRVAGDGRLRRRAVVRPARGGRVARRSSSRWRAGWPSARAWSPTGWSAATRSRAPRCATCCATNLLAVLATAADLDPRPAAARLGRAAEALRAEPALHLGPGLDQGRAPAAGWSSGAVASSAARRGRGARPRRPRSSARRSG